MSYMYDMMCYVDNFVNVGLFVLLLNLCYLFWLWINYDLLW